MFAECLDSLKCAKTRIQPDEANTHDGLWEDVDFTETEYQLTSVFLLPIT